MFVVNRMTANPVTIAPDTTVAEASELMRSNKCRRLPVLNQGKLVGIVTDRDLREVSPSPATTLSIFELNYLLAKMQVHDIMAKDVITINVNATIEEAALLMYNHRIGGLVVVDDTGTVVGVLTETDIFKSFVDIMGLPAGKTRLTFDVTNKVGVIHEIVEIFAELGINISSLASYVLPDGRGQMVIRADTAEVKTLVTKLTAKGFPVTHIAQIG